MVSRLVPAAFPVCILTLVLSCFQVFAQDGLPASPSQGAPAVLDEPPGVDTAPGEEIPGSPVLHSGTAPGVQPAHVTGNQAAPEHADSVTPPLASPGSAPHDETFESGQDFTRPVRRIEAAASHRDLAGDAWVETLTLRASLPVPLPGGWTLSLRAEQPYSAIKGASRNNPLGKRVNGFGEFLGEALAVMPPRGRWTYAMGALWIPPSASHDELGTGRHQLAPSLGVRYDLGHWMPGAWCGLMLRHAVDVAGYSGFDHISQSVAQPMLNIDLPGAWFVTFAPEARYDWKNSEWFVPFDMTAGRVIGRHTVVSLSYRSAVNDDMMLYVNTFEARAGYIF